MEIKTHYASFSEAIREGAKLRPQGREQLAALGRTCAIGAGLEAMGILCGDTDSYGFDGEEWDNNLYAFYSYLKLSTAECPVRRCKLSDDLFGLIVHLNDEHKWKRERIADWLETEEEKLGYVTVIDNELSLATTTVERRESFAGQEVLV